MNVSMSKILWLIATFRKSQVPQYLLDVANNWVVNGLAEATKEKIAAGLNTGKKILAALKKYSWLCPEKWRNAYTLTVQAFADVVVMCEDLKIEVAEIETCTASFKIAYAEWCAD